MNAKLVWPIAYSIIIIAAFIFSIGPLNGDEGLYAIAVKDVQKYGIMPYATYFGEPMLWKPPFAFLMYAILSFPFMSMDLPEEIALRVPSLMFTLASTLLFYLLIKDDLTGTRKYIAVLLFLASPPIFGYGFRLLTDVPAFFFTMLALYSTKMYSKEERIEYLALNALAIIFTGLSKTIVLSVFSFLLSILYYSHTKNPSMKRYINLAMVGIIGILIIGAYRMSAPYSGYMDIVRTLSLHQYSLSNNISFFAIWISPLGILALGITVVDALTKRKLDIYHLWALSSIGLVVSLFGLLPWYFMYFMPAIVVIVARKIEINILDEAIFFSVFLLTLINTILSALWFSPNIDDVDEISHYIAQMKGTSSNVMIITRLGEQIANSAYWLENKVIITPQISMRNKTGWFGVKEETLAKENMYRLIHDYNNESLVPKLTYLFTDKERYFPPVGRTNKTWEGGFDIIIAQKDYVPVIMKVAPEYKEAYKTQNGEFYVLEK